MLYKKKENNTPLAQTSSLCWKIKELEARTSGGYPELEKDDVYIKEIKEDEAIAYFIRFSNNDILHIYEYVDGLEDWFLNFEIVSPKNENYNEITTHMNETWVNRIM